MHQHTHATPERQMSVVPAVEDQLNGNQLLAALPANDLGRKQMAPSIVLSASQTILTR